MGTPRTIVFCCNTAFGLANFRAGIIQDLVNSGHKVIAVCPDDAYVHRLHGLGAFVEIWSINGGSMNAIEEMRSIYKLHRIYKKIKPDVVFNFTIKPIVYGAFIARITNVPCISVVTGLGYSFINRGWASALARFLYRITLRWSHEVWFLNNEDLSAFRQAEILNKRVGFRVLPGEGIDLNHFSPNLDVSSRDTTTFLLIGRLLYDKGVCEFVEAARRVGASGYKTRFQLLGRIDSSNPSSISRDTLEDWERSGVIEHIGAVEDVRATISNADCVVLPSYREGIPRSLLEAAAMEKPVIATNVPGCKDVVVDGDTGILCAPRDSGSLAECMIQFLNMPVSKRRLMGKKGRAHIERKFDERFVIDEYLSGLTRLFGTHFDSSKKN